MDRACHLIQELGAGEIMDGCIDVYPRVRKPHTLEVDSNWINSIFRN